MGLEYTEEASSQAILTSARLGGEVEIGHPADPNDNQYTVTLNKSPIGVASLDTLTNVTSAIRHKYVGHVAMPIGVWLQTYGRLVCDCEICRLVRTSLCEVYEHHGEVMLTLEPLPKHSRYPYDVHIFRRSNGSIEYLNMAVGRTPW